MKGKNNGIMIYVLLAELGISIFLIIFSQLWAYFHNYESEAYKQCRKYDESDVEQYTLESEDSMFAYNFWGVSDSPRPYGIGGYPSDTVSQQISSIQDLETYEDTAISFEVDVKQLKATGWYENVHDFPRGSMKAARHMWNRGVDTSPSVPLNTNSKWKAFCAGKYALYAQYYVLTLDSGEKILILLNDTAISLPKKGTVKLPLSLWSDVTLEMGYSPMDLALKSGVTITDKENVQYLDAASGWANVNAELDAAFKKHKEMESMFLVIGMFGIFLFVIILIVWSLGGEIKKNKG